MKFPSRTKPKERVVAELDLSGCPEGGRLTMTATKTENATFIGIQDTGVGIPKEDQARLFKPLFTIKSKGQGFGLAV